MNVTFAYLGRSQLRSEGSSRVLMLQPNLSREAVHFSADLKDPLRFREALSALHDVVINDLRYKPRDKTAYLEWKEGQKDRLAAIRREEYQRVKEELDSAGLHTACPRRRSNSLIASSTLRP